MISLNRSTSRMPDRQPLCHRLFVALMPTAEAAMRIGEMRDCLGSKGHVGNDRLHMTMGLLDDMASIPSSLIADVADALRQVRASPIHIILDRVSSHAGSCALVPEEPAFAIRALKGQITAALASVGLPMRAGWSFNPHVTLLYNPAEPRNEAIMPISWEAQEFVLIHSLVGLTRHILLDRFPLQRS